jgi:hypothetical protein
VGEWRPVIKGVPHQIVAVFMACKAEGTTTRLSGEHDEVVWIDPHDYAHYTMMEPDGQVIEAYLERIDH